MIKQLEHYRLLACLFEYPATENIDRSVEVQKILDVKYPIAGKILQPFTTFLSTVTLRERQELYIRSFDVQAVTTLDLGYVLFGDDYKRGELLVNLNREHKAASNDCRAELADHLTNVLRLLPSLDHAILTDLVRMIIAPALRRMIKSFEPDQIEIRDNFYKRKHKTLIYRSKNYSTIYKRPLQTLYSVLEKDFMIEENTALQKSSDFLKSISTEIKLEDE